MVTVFNALTMAASTYSIDAIDAIEIDGALHWATSDGLLALSLGAENVQSVLRTGRMNSGTLDVKRIYGTEAVVASNDITDVYVLTWEHDGEYEQNTSFVAGEFPMAAEVELSLDTESQFMQVAVVSNGTGSWRLHGLSWQAQPLYFKRR